MSHPLAFARGAPMKLDRSVLQKLPKVLLHEHLDGVLRPQTIIDLAGNAGYNGLPSRNATALAQQVTAQAPSINSAGMSAKQVQTEESVAGAIATVVVAALIYVFGGRMYRALWFYLYRNYIVRRSTGAS